MHFKLWFFNFFIVWNAFAILMVCYEFKKYASPITSKHYLHILLIVGIF